jgi:hypothetical protein
MISELLRFVDDRQMVLPEFQRDFDWGDDRVMQLLATVVRRWPAGSLLLQGFPGETFYHLREFEGGPKVDRDHVEFVVLDGQQRLTALYHAIYGTGKYVYAIQAEALQPGASIDDLEDAIASFSAEDWRAGARILEGEWIPFSSLRSAADFFAWRDDVLRHADPAGRDDLAVLLSDSYRYGLEAFHTYRMPAVVVEKGLEPAAIARIFERVNRGGLTLRAFDLMVARTFERGWNLRDRWEQAQVDYPVLADFFGDDGMPVIRTIALKSRNSVREGDVLQLPGLAVREDWDAAVKATASALAFLRDRCGVVTRERLPYAGMVITLAGLALETVLDDHDELIVKWFLSRAFGLRYDTAANTVTVEEYHGLRRVVQSEADLPRVTIIPSVLREATRKRRVALWRAFLATLGMRQAMDPMTGERLDANASVVAILPRMSPAPLTGEAPHLLVLNLVLMTRDSARSLQYGGSEMLRTALGRLGPNTSVVAESQLISMHALTDDEQFLRMRLEELTTFLSEQLDYDVVEYAQEQAVRP